MLGLLAVAAVLAAVSAALLWWLVTTYGAGREPTRDELAAEELDAEIAEVRAELAEVAAPHLHDPDRLRVALEEAVATVEPITTWLGSVRFGICGMDGDLVAWFHHQMGGRLWEFSDEHPDGVMHSRGACTDSEVGRPER